MNKPLDMKKEVFPPGKTPIGGSSFRFDCHPGVECFTRCCKGADMYLYPYDIIRMKRRLGINSAAFLTRHTVSAVRDNPFFPSVMLKMAQGPEDPCPFLTAEGCGIYEDRPSSCRTYPLERGVARMDRFGRRKDFYFLKRDSHCLGHGQDKEWTVADWITNQEIEAYNRMNDLWVDMDSLFRTNPWPKNENKQLRMAFMACFNVDQFREFVFDSSFLSRFPLSPDRIEQIKGSDEEMMTLGFEWVRFFLTGHPFTA